MRPDFDARQHVLAYHPSEAIDVPESIGNTLLYHILGDYHTSQDFAVWEEDYMKFICKLIEHQETLERLFRLLKNRQLLLLGPPATDWIVQFVANKDANIPIEEIVAVPPLHLIQKACACDGQPAICKLGRVNPRAPGLRLL